jgi:hypothetical protein
MAYIRPPRPSPENRGGQSRRRRDLRRRFTWDGAAGSPPTPRELDALIERYRGRRFAGLLRDPAFKRLGPTGAQALTAEYRRRATQLKAAAVEDGRSVEGAGRGIREAGDAEAVAGRGGQLP